MITTIAAPRINTNDDRIEVVVWHVEPGDHVVVGQEIVDVETTKSTVSIAAEAAGFICPLVKKGEVVPVGEPLYLCATSPEELEARGDTRGPSANASIAPASTAAAGHPVPLPAASHQVVSKATIAALPYAGTRFSREAALLLEERGLSDADFPAAGLLTARGLRTRLDGAVAPARAPVTFPQAVPNFQRHVRTERMTLAKQAEAESLTAGEGGNVTSTLTVSFESASIRARLAREHLFDGSLHPLVLYEVARLLLRYPNLTAWCADGHVYHYDAVDIGVAFDLGRGLKVVTFRDAATLSAIQLFERTIDAGLRYLSNRLAPDELTGSTFTITDLSGFDILHFKPLINGRQSAILGVGGDSRQLGHPMTLTLAFDHRVSNGREVAEFLNALRQRLASYAPAGEPEPPAPTFCTDHPGPKEIRCDRCAIDLPKYYRDFPKDAWMLAYFREDGTLGSVCHRCSGGWS